MSEQIAGKQDRIASIDVLRGFAMFLILSTQIGGAPIFKTFVKLFGPDFVAATAHQFSWTVPGMNLINIAQSIFIFVVGLVIPFSLEKRLAQTGKRKTYLHIVRRSLILFVLGTIAGGHLLDFKLATFYFYNNVLEYISIGYLVCSLLVLNTSEKTQWFVTGGILLLVWAIWGLIPAPGWTGDRFSTEMNIGIYLDRLLLGPHGHPFNGHWTATLNTISQIGVMMLGVLMGHIVFSSRDKTAKSKMLLGYGCGMLLIGWLWSWVYPSLRMFMTSSFVLETCGLATVLLAFFYWLVDIRGYYKWAFFFIVFGANSIAIYMMAHLFKFNLIGTVLVGGLCSHLSPTVGDFIQAVTAMAVMWLIMYYMYRKKTFIKI
jgi:predicted acyltransferase